MMDIYLVQLTNFPLCGIKFKHENMKVVVETLIVLLLATLFKLSAGLFSWIVLQHREK